MNCRNSTNIFKAIDTAYAISISLLCINIISASIFPIKFNHAIVNIIATLIPPLVILAKRKFIIRKSKRLFIGILLSICQIITIAIVIAQNHTEYAISDLVELACFIINILAYCSIDGSVKLNLKKTCISICLFSVVFCFYNLFTNYGIISGFSFLQGSQNVSFSSYFTNRNNFAMYLFLSLVIMNSIIGRKKSKIKNIVTIMIIVNLVLTFSRTAILATISYYFINYLFDGERKNIKKILAITFAVVCSIGLLYSPMVNKFIIRDEDGDSGRHQIWSSAIESFSERPLFGKGNTQAANYIKKNSGNAYFHNLFIKALTVYGLFYTMLLILLIVSQFKYIKELNNDYFGAISVMVPVLIYGLFEAYDFFGFGFFNLGFTMSFFFLPIMSHRLEHEEEEE